MGCKSSKGVGNGNTIEARQHGPRLTGGREPASLSHGPPDLSRSLAWIQEKNFEDKFHVVKVIGEGSFGEVSVVRRRWGTGSPSTKNAASANNITNLDAETAAHNGGNAGGGGGVESSLHRLYAMKSIHVNRLSKSRVAEFENEVQILQRLHHPNIIQLREVFYHKKRICMLMTLCTGGQLNQRHFNETQVCSVMSQVIRALVYMHETAKICHRDLKLENIMLESPEEPFVVKLIDFGLSKVFTDGDKMRTACGTIYTMAPEEKVERLRNAGFRFADPKWKTVSSGGKGFVRGLLKKQPGFRWTAREALDHCSDVWAPTLLSASDAGPCAQAGTAAAVAEAATEQEHANRQRTPLSPGGTPSSRPASPPTSYASRGRLRGVPNAIATSMRKFAEYGELKKAALMVTAFQLDKDEIKQLKDAFLEVDIMRNGAITLEELRTVLQEHVGDPSEVDRVFGAVDMDRSGRLHYMEFLAATIEARGYIEEERLKEAFERLDVDSTGFISRENLITVLGSTYDDALIDKMLKEGDLSLSGSIEWEDFLGMMRPVVKEEYRKEAEEMMLADTSPAPRQATEVERRAVDPTPSSASSQHLVESLTAEQSTTTTTTTTEGVGDR